MSQFSSEPTTIYVYCDGACRGNPGPGGWGVLLRYNGHERQLYGGDKQTTNNRMELMAAIKGLQALREPDKSVVVTTDSQYLRRGITEWLSRWKQQQWMTRARQPVKNQDLWLLLDQEASRHQIHWAWVKGHSGHLENEIADQLANRGIDEL